MFRSLNYCNKKKKRNILLRNLLNKFASIPGRFIIYYLSSSVDRSKFGINDEKLNNLLFIKSACFFLLLCHLIIRILNKQTRRELAKDLIIFSCRRIDRRRNPPWSFLLHSTIHMQSTLIFKLKNIHVAFWDSLMIQFIQSVDYFLSHPSICSLLVAVINHSFSITLRR